MAAAPQLADPLCYAAAPPCLLRSSDEVMGRSGNRPPVSGSSRVRVHQGSLIRRRSVALSGRCHGAQTTEQGDIVEGAGAPRDLFQGLHRQVAEAGGRHGTTPV